MHFVCSFSRINLLMHFAFTVERSKAALNSYNDYLINLDDVTCKDIQGLLISSKKNIILLFDEYLKKWTNFKVMFLADCLFSNYEKYFRMSTG